MPDKDGDQTGSARADPTVSKVAVIGDVTEETDTAAHDKETHASPDEIDAKAPSGSSGDDDVEYVHGHPVIRNGK
jgi:hypothetical protein